MTLTVTLPASGDDPWDTVLNTAINAIVTAVNAGGGGVTLPIAESDVTSLVSDLAAKAPLASPTLTGTPAAPTASGGTNTTQVATTAFVHGEVATSDSAQATALALKAALASPTFSGTPSLPTGTTGTTQTAGDSSTKIATTAFVTTAVAGGGGGGGAVSSVAGRTGAVTLAVADVSGAAPLASPALTGNPTAPTASGGDNDTSIATTAFVHGEVATSDSAQATALALKAPLASPTFTGTPSLPTGTTASTQTAGDSSTKIATTAFATTADNLKANLASPTFTGTPSLPTGTTGTTQTAGDSSTKLATTAFVATAVSGGGGAVSSVAGRTGAVTLAVADVSGAAPLASPTFTGTPSLPTGTTAVTQAVGDSDTSLATTAFVMSAARFAMQIATPRIGWNQVPQGFLGTSNGTPTRKKVYFAPISIGPNGYTSDNCFINIATAASGGSAPKLMVGLYPDDGSGWPDVAAGPVLTTTFSTLTATGGVTSAWDSGATVIAPGMYWIAVLYDYTTAPSTAPQFSCYTNTSWSLPAQASVFGLANPRGYLSAAATYTSLPTGTAFATSDMVITGNTDNPVVSIRRSA